VSQKQVTRAFYRKAGNDLSSYSYLDLIQERYPQPGCLKVYQAIRQVICGRTLEVDWTSFTSADWTLLGVMASRDGVAGLVYQAWKQNQRPAGVPGLLIAQLGAAFIRNQGQFSTFQTELYDRIEPALAVAGQKMIILKGMALAGTLYSLPGMRPMQDMDVLVHRTDLPMIITTLKSLGYATEKESLLLSDLPDYGHHIGMKGAHVGVQSLELHYSLMAPRKEYFKLDMEWFFSQTELLRSSPSISMGRSSPSSSMGRGSLLTFTPAAHLLHLALHLMIHHGEGEIDLLHYYDIHLLLERWGERINWDKLVQSARGMNLDYVVFSVLQGCSERFDTTIPKVFTQAPSGHSAQLVKQFIETRRKLILTKHSENYLKALAGQPFISQIKVLLRFAFPQPEFMRQRYAIKPVWLWPLTYPIRWIISFGQLFNILLRQYKG
jgi:hypothetical protein